MERLSCGWRGGAGAGGRGGQEGRKGWGGFSAVGGLADALHRQRARRRATCWLLLHLHWWGLCFVRRSVEGCPGMASGGVHGRSNPLSKAVMWARCGPGCNSDQRESEPKGSKSVQSCGRPRSEVIQARVLAACIQLGCSTAGTFPVWEGQSCRFEHLKATGSAEMPQLGCDGGEGSTTPTSKTEVCSACSILCAATPSISQSTPPSHCLCLNSFHRDALLLR